jgi:hypothetical protein
MLDGAAANRHLRASQREDDAMAARLFQRSKTAMQSGKARAGEWVLQFESRRPKRPDPLTGWSGGAETQEQVTLTFPTLEAGKRYAERARIDYHIVPSPPERPLRIQAYADNFK